MGPTKLSIQMVSQLSETVHRLSLILPTDFAYLALFADSKPGPGSYHPKLESRIPGGLLSSACAVHYPDCLQYIPYLRAGQTNPGAGDYNPTNHCIGKTSAPKISMGRKPNTRGITRGTSEGR